MFSYFKSEVENAELYELDKILSVFKTMTDKLESFRSKVNDKHNANLVEIASLEAQNQALSAHSNRAFNVLLKLGELVK